MRISKDPLLKAHLVKWKSEGRIEDFRIYSAIGDGSGNYEINIADGVWIGLEIQGYDGSGFCTLRFLEGFLKKESPLENNQSIKESDEKAEQVKESKSEVIPNKKKSSNKKTSKKKDSRRIRVRKSTKEVDAHV